MEPAFDKDAQASEKSVRRLWFCPLTHWDREWYMTLEDFRVRLGATIDELIDVMHADPTFRFTLDGQAVILEDYLEIRPERQGELLRLVHEGRLTVGPFYVLPDEFLVGQESLVRNLMLGRQTCWRYGARPMALGYLPDSFGHVAQLPAVLQGFGIDSFAFTRGLGDEAEDLGAAFLWRSRGGSSVLALPLLGGYGNAGRIGLPREFPQSQGGIPLEKLAENALNRIDDLTERYAERLARAGLEDFLLCNGGDHEPVQENLPAILAECANRRPETSFRIATFEDYAHFVGDRAAELASFEGELLGGFEHNVLRGVNSARMYLKQANELAEREILLAETVAALAVLKHHSDARHRYPLGEMRLAWRELLRNHPHDSISGCSVDEVHQDMHQRFRTAREIARRVQRQALGALAGRRDEWSYQPLEAETFRLSEPSDAGSLVNTLPFARRRAVLIRCPGGLRGAQEIRAETRQGDLPVQLVETDGERSLALVATVEGFGSLAFRLRGSSVAPTSQAFDDHAIANEFFSVEAQEDGSLTVTELESGDVFTRVGYFEDIGDRGDEYTFDPTGEEFTTLGGEARVMSTVRGPVMHELTVRLPLRLPASLSADRRDRRGVRSCPILMRVRLWAGVRRIDFTTSIHNRARDHRLRVRFPVRRGSESIRVEGHYSVLRRAPTLSPRKEWFEPPHSTNHTCGAVAMGATAVVGRGLPEYEVVESNGEQEIALTLLRCVGWLSRSDLTMRRGPAGPELETPEAQCSGEHTFEYSVVFGADKMDDGALVRASQDFRFPFLVGPPDIDTDGLLDVAGDGHAFAALKGAEDGRGVVLRIFNPGERGARTRVVGAFARACRSRLDETVTEPRSNEQHVLVGGEVMTLRLLP